MREALKKIVAMISLLAIATFAMATVHNKREYYTAAAYFDSSNGLGSAIKFGNLAFIQGSGYSAVGFSWVVTKAGTGASTWTFKADDGTVNCNVGTLGCNSAVGTTADSNCTGTSGLAGAAAITNFGVGNNVTFIADTHNCSTAPSVNVLLFYTQ